MLPAALQRTRFLALVCFWCLVLYFGFALLAAATPPAPLMLVAWLLQVLPLLLFLPGLVKGNPRSLLWLSLVDLLYFIHGVLVAFDPARRWLGIVECVLSALLFICLALFLRQRRQYPLEDS